MTCVAEDLREDLWDWNNMEQFLKLIMISENMEKPKKKVDSVISLKSRPNHVLFRS
jgi:hypothetical protein